MHLLVASPAERHHVFGIMGITALTDGPDVMDAIVASLLDPLNCDWNPAGLTALAILGEDLVPARGISDVVVSIGHLPVPSVGGPCSGPPLLAGN